MAPAKTWTGVLSPARSGGPVQCDDFTVRQFPDIASIGLSDAPHRLRVAIVTEEIIGPVRNGGIASTYFHLARGLAARGHDVHVLFLKGPVVQDETPQHWVDRYAGFGVTLHYLEPRDTPVVCSAPPWQRRYASAYEWLRDQEPFDVVHTSEWRGGLVYALMAKRLGLAFGDTLFLVKTSSPYIWNRHYQMQPITDPHLVAAAYAEQQCVELADLVIGGSAHLISFMDRIGYRLPDHNVYVQPNIMDFSTLEVPDRRPGPREPGDVVRTRDLVFFGRLEARKGIEIFCSAVDLLHERGEVPDSVTFLGKWGARLPAQGNVTPEDFVAQKAEGWRCPVSVVTDRNQAGALELLCERDVVAVMPSLIENSSMAVYETLDRRVPFVATAVGGTPELIAEEDHAACLVEPTSQALADRLACVLRDGQVIARPRFSNDRNLDVWYGFHAYVGGLIAEHGRSEAVARLTAGVDRPGPPVRTVSFVALVRRGDSLEDLSKAFRVEAPDQVVLGYADAGVRAEIDRVQCALVESGADVRVVSCLGQASGTALNSLVASQTADAMVVAHGIDAVPEFGYFDAVRRALGFRPGCLVTTFASDEEAVAMPLGSDVASQVLTSRAYGPEVVALRTETFEEIGAFEPYDAPRGIVHEYVTRAAGSDRDLLVVPEQLLRWPKAVEHVRALHTDLLYSYLKAKPLIDASGLAERKVLLAALHPGAGKVTVGGVDEGLLRLDAEEDDAGHAHWLVPATWDPEDGHSLRHRRVLFGLEPRADRIWLYARGPGERRLTVRGEEVVIEEVARRGAPDSADLTTLAVFRIPESWPPGTSYPLVWGVYDGTEKLRNTLVRVNKIGRSTYVLSGRHPVLAARVLTELVDRCPGSSSEDADPSPDPTDDYVDRAVAAARTFLEQRAEADPVRVIERSRALLAGPPPSDLPPITARSGLKPPQDRDGWLAGDWLLGWAWDREDRDRTLHVALMCGSEPLVLVPASVVDRSIDDVPGRGRHAFRIPVLPEHLDNERLRLVVWEGGTLLHRGRLYVDRGGEQPMLRRVREQPVEVSRTDGTTTRKRRWWSPR